MDTGHSPTTRTKHNKKTQKQKQNQKQKQKQKKRYLRLDGSTKIEQRQHLIEKFNTDARYFVFILSTRSGGVGVNLTGADTVIFYDSDWNPAMDAQAQDRCHRIGQTRDVHIYRLVTESTIEENILKKANQKRLLDDVVIQGGAFTTEFFEKQMDWKGLFRQRGLQEDVVEQHKEKEAQLAEKNISQADFEQAMTSVEDEDDVVALRQAKMEETQELEEFDPEPSETPEPSRESLPETPSRSLHSTKEGSPTPSPLFLLHKSLNKSTTNRQPWAIGQN